MKNIEGLYREWQGLQPLSKKDEERLERKFILDFNYNSNHLEGNTLTYGQTELLLMFDKTSGDAKLRDYQEMKAHNLGLILVRNEAKDRSRPLSERFIRELNKTILVENFYKSHKTNIGEGRYEVKVGVYKTRPNSVITLSGETFNYASPEETPAMMTDLVTWYNKEEEKGELSPIALAALLHYRYIRIHPFEDGNGRIARLLTNYVLFRHGYPMIIVESKDKERYLHILNKTDISVGLTPSEGANASLESIQPFQEYIEELARYSLEISIKAAQGKSIEEEDDFSKQITLLERKAKTQSKTIKRNQDQIWNVLEYFYFPLKDRLVKALEPAKAFFISHTQSNKISKTSHKANSLDLNSVHRDTNNHQVIDYVSNAQALFFQYKLEHPRTKYQIKDLSITIEFDIQFKEDYYAISSLDNKKFKYETYPTGEDVEKIISFYKAFVLKKIEDAIQK